MSSFRVDVHALLGRDLSALPRVRGKLPRAGRRSEGGRHLERSSKRVRERIERQTLSETTRRTPPAADTPAERRGSDNVGRGKSKEEDEASIGINCRMERVKGIKTHIQNEKVTKNLEH